MALTGTRLTKSREAVQFVHPVAASAVIHQGALVCLDAAGDAVPGAVAAGLTAAGVARAAADNSAGSAGDAHVEVERGCFSFVNAGGVTRSHIGAAGCVVDDETVAADDDGGSRSPVGTIRDVDADGVWVEI